MSPTNPVPVLSDDVLREIETRPIRTVHYDHPFVPLSEVERDALCQTVRALRASDEHNYQLWLDLKERHKHKFASADGKWSDTCQQCGVTTGDDHDGHDCVAWLQRTNTALREQLAQEESENAATRMRDRCVEKVKDASGGIIACRPHSQIGDLIAQLIEALEQEKL